MRVIILLGILLLLLGSCVRCTRTGLRVFLGEEDTQGEFPFAVLLQRAQAPFTRYCSGSLIAQNWVLTAGHCIIDVPTVIKYGEFTKKANESKSYTRVIKTFVHPNLRSEVWTYVVVLYNDIAIVLIEKMPDKRHVKLCALDYKSLYGLPAKYAGFGSVFEGNPKAYQILQLQTKPLQVGEGVLVPCEQKTKIEEYKLEIFQMNPIMCVMPKCSNRLQSGRGGDSGGPLVYSGRIVGICSAGVPPYFMYTPVSPYLTWIQGVIQSNSKFHER